MLRNLDHDLNIASRAVPSRARRSCAECPVREIAPCAVLDADEVVELERRCGNPTVRAGQVIFIEGDDVDGVYTVLAGTVRVCKLLPDGRRQVVDFLTAGDCLGHTDDAVYSYTAEAVDDVVLCRVDPRTHGRLRATNPHLENRLLRSVGTDLARARDHMALLCFGAPLDRLAAFLLQLRERAAGDGPAPDVLELPMKRQDIADYLGVTIETVSRNFTRLRKRGLIELPSTQVVVLKDIDALEDLAAG